MFWQLWVVAGKLFSLSQVEPALIAIARYLPGFLCQCHCQGYRPYLLASPAWIGIHPLVHPHVWHLVLS